MTRLELLRIVVGQARANGFAFRRWYTGNLDMKWTTPAEAFTTLASGRRYYALLFSHEFAEAFWKAGAEITFQVPQQTFQRTRRDGSVLTVTRKPFTRRSGRKDAWRYHLREMALAEEPLRYIRKYLRVGDELEEDAHGKKRKQPAKGTLGAKRAPRTLPSDVPAFLRRPYP